MSVPMFDGQYRSRPIVSLRGASKKVEKGALLKQAHKEREHREAIRRQHQAALIIQASYRAHVHKQQIYASLRQEFDGRCISCTTVNEVLHCSRLLMICYSERKDHERLIKLCRKWLELRNLLSKDSSNKTVVYFHLSCLLSRCMHSLAMDPSQNLAIPLRMLEVYLTPSTYPQVPGTDTLMVPALLHYLVTRGFFKCLRTLLEHRVPPPDGDHTTSFPLSDSLLSLMTRPLTHGKDDVIFMSFFNEMFSSPLSPHVCYLVLPHMMNSDLISGRLIESLLVGVAKGGVTSSLELLFGILKMIHSQLESKLPTQQLLGRYLQLLAMLLNTTPMDHMMSHDSDDEYDFDDVMSVDGDDPLSSQEGLLRCCLSIISDDSVAVQIQNEVTKTQAGLESMALENGVKQMYFEPELLKGLSSLCFQLISHSGSHGNTTYSYKKTKLFQKLSFVPSLLKPLWEGIIQLQIQRSFGDPVSCFQQLARGVNIPPREGVALVEMLTTFCSLFKLYLATLHDAEFYQELPGSTMPFAQSDLPFMVKMMRDVFISLHHDRHLPPSSYSKTKNTTSRPTAHEWACLKTSLLDVLCALYDRDCRQPFCPLRHWEALHLQNIPPELFIENDEDEDVPAIKVAPSVMKQLELLKKAPFVFPFIERVKYFMTLVSHDRGVVQGHLQDFLMGPSIRVTARRNHIYEDGFSELAQGADLRKKLRVTLINAQGLDEPGIDGGGVFREFLNELLKTGFDPNRGYFTTSQDGQLYPNPHAHLFNEDYRLHYQFLGSMLGKALYEGLLVELPFAGFFLCKLRASGRGNVGVHHLASFDPELYRHLLSLKHYDGDIEALDLNFTTVTEEFGQTKVIELKPGGANIPVTRDNCTDYIQLMAHYILNTQMNTQFIAFRRGLDKVLPLHWLQLFNQMELQTLISGAEVPINIADLQANTKYAGEYKEDHDCIKMFWKVVSQFSEREKRALLKFVTSCSRPPLLGFKELYPPLRILPGQGEERLPSASTCMNMLKLPVYHDMETMRSKLLYAIESGAGFELS